MKAQDLVNKLNSEGSTNVRLATEEDLKPFNGLVIVEPIVIKSKALLQQEALEKKAREGDQGDDKDRSRP